MVIEKISLTEKEVKDLLLNIDFKKEADEFIISERDSDKISKEGIKAHGLEFDISICISNGCGLCLSLDHFLCFHEGSEVQIRMNEPALERELQYIEKRLNHECAM